MEKTAEIKHIKFLDKNTASKIAAGEVIERPSSVLKELLENALDAGANTVDIEIEKAGKKLIYVHDDGLGIPKEDMPAALARHATSKITNFEDLSSLNTFGFRGEALFSVCAVSRLEITSCARGAKEGVKLIAEGGSVISQVSSAAVQGTTVQARDLFFNTPARLKFLKSDAVERAHLLACAEECALANQTVSFNVKSDGAKVYSLPAQAAGEEGLRKRALKIMGEGAKDLIYLEDETFGFKALVSPCDRLSPNRNLQFFFVNKRPVVCKILQQAIYKAYQNFRAKDKHPIIILFLTLPPADFDVNVHPQKRDIKFAQESKIFSFIFNSILNAITGGASAQSFETPFSLPQKEEKNTSFAPLSARAAFSEQSDKTGYAPAAQSEVLSMLLSAPAQKEPCAVARDFEEPSLYRALKEKAEQPKKPEAVALKQENANAPLWWTPPYNYIGQLHKSYLIFENPQGLVLIEQHAAQERVLFEKYFTALNDGQVEVQPLMFPSHIALSASQGENIMAWQQDLQKAGFDISRFSSSTILVSSAPALLKMGEGALKDFIGGLADILGSPSKTAEDLKYKLIATFACKKAVKAGQSLDITQAQALLDNLKLCKDGLHCPHGRPTIINLEMKDIIKRFGRTS